MGLNNVGLRFNSTSPIKTEISAISPVTENPEVVEKVANALQAVSPDQIGYFHSIGLAQSWWWPPDLFQHAFEYVHVYSGLPWWATIGLVTIGMRALMFPMYFKASDMTARFSKLQPEMQKILDEYQNASNPLDGQKALLRRKRLMQEHNIKYRYLLGPIMGAPFFIGIFAGLNRMAHVPVAGLLDEGLAWFSNLSVADPYLGLQIITALVYSATFKLGGEVGGGSSPAASTMKKILPYMPWIAVPFTMHVPAATCFYFAVNGFISCLQALAFQSPAFRRAVGMAPMIKHAHDPTKSQNALDSFKGLVKNIQEKAEESARKARQEKEQALKYETQRAKEQDRSFIKITNNESSVISAANKGKNVKKGDAMRL